MMQVVSWVENKKLDTVNVGDDVSGAEAIPEAMGETVCKKGFCIGMVIELEGDHNELQLVVSQE